MKRITTAINIKIKVLTEISLEILLILCVGHFTILSVFAKGIGTTGAQFLKIGVGARPVGMGSCFIAVADDANTAYWNPSGFSQIKGGELTTMYLSWFEGINYGYIGYAQACGKNLGVGGALTYLTTGDIPQTSIVGEGKGAFKGEDIAFIFSIGKRFYEKISLGNNIKIIQQKIDSETANGYAFDLGMLYHISQNTNLGLVVQNIGSKIKFVAESDNLPLNWKVGVACKLLNRKLIVALDINFPIDQKVSEYVGTEYWLNDLIAMRAGYRTDVISYLGNVSGLSAGMGVKLANYAIDYAWVSYGDLGKTHRFSVLISF